MADLNLRGVHHVGLRVSDAGRSRDFYSGILGFAVLMEAENFCLVDANGTILGLLAPSKTANDRFDPFRVGVDHLAFAVPDLQSLETVKQHLDDAVVKNNGLETDPTLNTKYVSFFDPDGIAWEAYLVP